MVSTFDVLLVEDNPSDVELFREAVARSTGPGANLRLQVSETADEAWALLAAGPLPDLVVLDYNLPGAKGDALLRRVRRNAGTSVVPVVVMSSSRAEQDIQAAYANFCNAYILKPDHFRDLVAVVEGLSRFFGELAVRAVPRGRAA